MDIASVGASGAYVPAATPTATGSVQAAPPAERVEPRPVEASNTESPRMVVNAQGQQTGKIVNTTA
ncbi:MAG: hypothetical protein ACK5JI_04300 [Azonexus sp.]